MTEIQTYLALESALLRITPAQEEDPEGFYSTFLTRMDAFANGRSYGIFESEDPIVTLAWKRAVSARGFSPRGFGYYFSESFLDTLGKLSSQVPSGLYDDEIVRASDASWGIDVPAKACRLRSREMTQSDYTSCALRLLSEQTKAEARWFLKWQLKNQSDESIAEEINNLENIHWSAISDHFRYESGNYASDFDCFLALIQAEHSVDHLARIGKTAFRLLADSWFVFDEGCAENNPVKLELEREDTPEYPTPEFTATRLIFGLGLAFTLEGKHYFAYYPTDDRAAYLFEDNKLVERGTIDGFLTNARFVSEGRAKRMNLLKAFREATEKRAVAPEQAKRLFADLRE